NQTFTLTGTFHDNGTLDTQTVVIDWGGGGAGQPAEGTTTLTTAGPNPPGTSLVPLGNGDWQFTAGHQYLDDNPTGTSFDTYQVRVTATDDDGGSGSGTFPLQVNDVAPTVQLGGATAVAEGGTTTLTGTIADVGTLDTF